MSAEVALQTPHHVLRVVRRLAVDGASGVGLPSPLLIPGLRFRPALGRHGRETQEHAWVAPGPLPFDEIHLTGVRYQGIAVEEKAALVRIDPHQRALPLGSTDIGQSLDLGFLGCGECVVIDSGSIGIKTHRKECKYRRDKNEYGQQVTKPEAIVFFGPSDEKYGQSDHEPAAHTFCD